MGQDVEEADEFRQTIHGAIEKADTVLASSSVSGPAHSAPATLDAPFVLNSQSCS